MTMMFGEITRSGTAFNLEFERILATDVDDLWNAVTDRDRLARWMAPYSGDLVLGGTWQALGDDGGVWCSGTVTECEPPHRFVTSWHAIEESPTVLTVTVDAVPDGARLRLQHDGVQSIYYGPGWQTYLEQLDDLLGAAPASVADPTRAAGVGWDERYEALRPVWEERFGALRE
ncbi:MAG TPA: SRPBCC domain-containing protein [Terrimesophilobacter sp.]|nr:SRPBCC domain-containing protein [Terrimesophilobacter sp.]